MSEIISRPMVHWMILVTTRAKSICAKLTVFVSITARIGNFDRSRKWLYYQVLKQNIQILNKNDGCNQFFEKKEKSGKGTNYQILMIVGYTITSSKSTTMEPKKHIFQIFHFKNTPKTISSSITTIMTRKSNNHRDCIKKLKKKAVLEVKLVISQILILKEVTKQSKFEQLQ